MVDVDEAAIYGFEITNATSVPLYVSMFYFDVSDLSISTLSFSSSHSARLTQYLCRFVLPTRTCEERH